jgi:hypothetical protein
MKADKNIDGQYSSKLYETQYLLSLALNIEASEYCQRRSQQLRDVGCVARILGLLLGILLQTNA